MREEDGRHTKGGAQSHALAQGGRSPFPGNSGPALRSVLAGESSAAAAEAGRNRPALARGLYSTV